MNDRLDINQKYLQQLKEGKSIYGHESKMYKYNNKTKMIDIYTYVDADCVVDTKKSITEDEFLKYY